VYTDAMALVRYWLLERAEDGGLRAPSDEIVIDAPSGANFPWIGIVQHVGPMSRILVYEQLVGVCASTRSARRTMMMLVA
jgi:hypothetical protein